MKNELILILTYVVTITLVTLTTFNPEEYIIKDAYMAALTGLIYIVFTIGWGRLVQQIKFNAFHKWLFVLITWYTLLTIGDILLFQKMPSVLIMLGVLLFILGCLYVYRANGIVVDALTAALLLLILYIAMRIEHTIFPGAIIGGIFISMPFLIIAAKKSLRATQVLARLVFFLMAFTVLFLFPGTPIIAEGGYLLYLVIIIIVVAFVLRRKIELLLPQEAMPVLLVVTLVMYGVKFI
ncbi:hypothetical protein H9635_17205 [Solibacillus sp. A46]|uniref:Prepilin type IV endopeptidase peptidase domain-containing protein n=1 Tax=Solibacillus faecavium TaxID=2762221 RepID=A0ABR8Y2R1_9BACL|nr:hypothetical protein [Solibacillus faecavium]MBD8038485.1 hypothetical protein [Solibacillus faecavium]